VESLNLPIIFKDYPSIFTTKKTTLHYQINCDMNSENLHLLFTCYSRHYGAPFAKILYLTDLAQKVLSLRIYSYLCTDL